MAKKKSTDISSEVLSSPEMAKRYLEIADVIMLILDRRGDIVLINRKVEEVLGWKKKELIGKNWFETCLPENERKKTKKYFDKIITGEIKGDTRAENFIVKKNGEERLIAWNNRTLKDSKGNIICTLSSGEDITEIRNDEEELKKSEEKYRRLFETMVQGVVYQDKDGKIISANPAAEKILGLTFDQMTGRTSVDPRWKAIHEDGSDFPGDTHPSMVALKTGKEVKNQIMGIYNPSNEEYRWIIINAVPLFRQGEKKPYQTYTTFNDITERQKSRKHIEHLNRLLSSIRNINQLIVKERNKDILLKSVCEILVEVSGYLFVWIGFIYEDHKRVIPVAKWGFDDGYLDVITVTWDDEVTAKGPTGTAIRTKKACAFKDLMKNSDYFPWREEAGKRGYKSSVGVPLVYKDKVYGALNVYADSTDYFDDDEVSLLNEVAQDVAYALSYIDEEEIRRQAEIDLIESQRKLSTLIDNLPGIAYRCKNDKNWTMELISDGCFKITGYYPEDFIGNKNVSFGDTINHPDDQKYVWDEVQQALKEDRPFQMEYRIKTASGETKWVWEQGVGVRSDDGKDIMLEGYIVDVSQKKEAENALIQSEKRFRSLVENLNDIVFRADSKGVITYISPVIEKILSYKIEEVIGHPITDFIHPDDVPLAIRKRKEILAGTSDPYILRFLDKKGAIKYIRRSCRAVFDGENHPEITGILTDITEQKLAEDKIRESEEKWRGLFENSIEAVFTVDTRGNFTTMNDALAEIMGYEREEIIGSNYKKFADKEDLEFILKAYNKLYRTGEPITNLVYKTVRKDGEARTLEVYINVIRKGDEIIGFQGTLRDITDRMRAEEALQNSEAQLSNALRIARAGHWEYDVASDTFTFNDNFYRIFRTTAEEVGGYRLSSDDYARRFCHPDDIDLVGNEVQAAVKTTEPNYSSQLEHRILYADGEVGYIAVRFFIVKDAQGRTVKTYGVNQDITEHYRAEEELRKSEEKYRTILENINDGYFEVDIAGNFTFFNGSMCKILGYSKAEMLGMNNRKYMDEETAKDVYRVFNEVFKTKKTRKVFDWELIRKDKDRVYVSTSITPILDKEENVVGFRGIARDISERKKVQEELRESQERFRKISEVIPVTFGMFSPSLEKVLFVSAAFESMYGYPCEDFYNNAGLWYEMIHEDDKKEVAIKIASNIYQELDIECRIVRPDGTVRWLNVRTFPAKDENGELSMVVWISEDITEKKKIDDDLKKSEESYRSLVENINDVIYNLDADGNFTFVSKRIKDLSKYVVEDLMGKPFLDFIHPDDLPPLLESYKRTQEGVIEPSEYRVYDKDGTIIFVQSSGRPMIKDGEIVGITGVITDITERKKMEEQLIQAEKLSSLGGILSGVAHELNNPLTAIIGNAQILMRRDIPSDIKDKLEVIEKESIRSSKIVGGLLAFARKHKAEKKMININDVIMDAHKLREYELRVDNITINLDLSEDIPLTSADPYQLQQVFINLINNAHSALLEKSGGILDIRTSKNKDKIIIEFEDDGYGIPKEHLRKIFDPFFTTKEVGKGTGLGLSIVYGIITEHGGVINVNSEMKKGTKFTIELPILKEIIREKGKRIEKPERPEEVINILVVEDEDSLREFLVEALESEGYSVEMTNSGEEAIKLLDKREYDIIISDMKMPGISGQNIYTYIQRKNPGLAEKMVFITGDILGQETQNFLKISGARFIEKPFQLDELFSLLIEMLVEKKDSN